MQEIQQVNNMSKALLSLWKSAVVIIFKHVEKKTN